MIRLFGLKRGGMFSFWNFVLGFWGMTITLNVTERDATKSAKSLRANGEVPAVIYGSSQAAISVTVNGKEFEKVLKEAGESTILELTGLDKKTEVLLKEVDFNPVKQEVIHADFYVVEQGKEIVTHVPLHFIDEAPVEKSGGIVNKVMQDIEVACKPADLPDHIDVSLAQLANLEDKIVVKDINLPKGVTTKVEEDSAVVTVSAAREEEEEAVSEAPDMDAIEVEDKGKKEDESAEG